MITKQKGCHDIYGVEAKRWKYVDKLIDSLMEKYNYSYMRTPLFEASELFHRGIGEASDIVTKETYDFTDRGDRAITLRPEGTAGIVRSYIENKMYGDPIQPVKVYYNGTMYRYERPQSGRDRELTQFGVEVLGCEDAVIDAEVISLAVNFYRLLGLTNVKVQINSLGDEESRKNYRNVLIEYFRPHIDELCEDCKMRFEKNPLRILDCKVDADKPLLKNAPKTIAHLNEVSKKRFEEVLEYLDLLKIDYEVNPNIVRGLDYYQHTVFEFTADIPGMGSQSALGAGGRYNGLVHQLGGPETAGIGFGIGIGRTLLALEKAEIKLPVEEEIDAFILYINDEEKKYATYLAQELRLNGFSVDMEYQNRNLKGQFRQAERLNAKFLLILNSEDLDNNELKIKDARSKEEEIISMDALIYYLDEKLAMDEYISSEEDLEESDCHCHGTCHHDHEHECHSGHNCSCHHHEEN